jgi:hypothetical protein
MSLLRNIDLNFHTFNANRDIPFRESKQPQLDLAQRVHHVMLLAVLHNGVLRVGFFPDMLPLGLLLMACLRTNFIPICYPLWSSCRIPQNKTIHNYAEQDNTRKEVSLFSLTLSRWSWLLLPALTSEFPFNTE